MLTFINLQNFKGFREASISLERLTAIVGPNASGKTTILEGIDCLSELKSTAPKFIFSGMRSPVALRRRDQTGAMVLGCSGPEGGVRLTVAGRADMGDLTRLSDPEGSPEWSYKLERKGPGPEAADWEDVGDGRSFRDESHLRSTERPSVLLELNASALAAPYYSPIPRPRVFPNGMGLPSVLAHLALNFPDDFLRIQERLKSLVPSVKRIRFDRVLTHRREPQTVSIDGETVTRLVEREYVGDAILFDFQDAQGVPAYLASEGTLLALGLLTVLMSPAHPKLILLDDVDHGLHPRAQRNLVGLLRRFLEDDPETQIVMTTHSPYLLDSLEPEEIRLTTLNDDGSAACASPVDHPDFDRWKDEMTPGEMWSLFGEKWAASRGA